MNDQEYEQILQDIAELKARVSELKTEIENTNGRAAEDVKHIYAAIDRSQSI